MSIGGESPSGELSDFETQFVPQPDDDEVLWEVIEIVDERDKKYQVRWAGNDPNTGKPWPLDWIPKHDCTDRLVEEWKRKKAEKRRRSKKTGRCYHASVLTRIIPSARWPDGSQVTLSNFIKGLYDFFLPKDALCCRRQCFNRRRRTPTCSALDLKTTELEA